MSDKIDYKQLGDQLGKPWDLILGNLERRLSGNGIVGENQRAAMAHIVHLIGEAEIKSREDIAGIDKRFALEFQQDVRKKISENKQTQVESIKKRIGEVFNTPVERLKTKMSKPERSASEELLHELRINRVLDAVKGKDENEIFSFAREAVHNKDFVTYEALTGLSGPLKLLPDHLSSRVKEEFAEANFPGVLNEISQWKRAGEIAAELAEKLEQKN